MKHVQYFDTENSKEREKRQRKRKKEKNNFLEHVQALQNILINQKVQNSDKNKNESSKYFFVFI